MGFISDIMGGKAEVSSQGRATWDRVFGVEKERPHPKVIQPMQGSNSTAAGTPAAQVRLLQAMRSKAPGGWSDDRWEQSRHWTGIEYIAGHRKCEQLAQSEFQVFKEDLNHQDGKRPLTPNDGKAYDFIRLLKKPNWKDTFGDFMYRIGQQMLMTGSALIWMIPNVFGDQILEMYVLPTALCVPQSVINPDYPHGYYRMQPVYPYGPFSTYPTPQTSVGAVIPAQWVVKIQYPHPLLWYDGFSPQTALALYIDELTSIDRSRWYKMRRDLNPSAVLQGEASEGMEPLPDDEMDRIHAEWQNEKMGPENAGKLIISTPGFKLEEWGKSAKEMDYAAGWEQLTSITTAGFGMTKPVAGMVDDQSYSTLFASLKQVSLLTLQPDCNRIAGQLTRQIGPFFGDDLICEIKCPRIDDHEITFSKIDKGIAAKCVTKNEVRKMLDLPITTEPWGDEFAGAEQGAENMPGGEGQPGAAAPGSPAAQQEAQEAENEPVEPPPAPPEIENSRPRTNTLGRGALGPRKSLNGYHGKNGATLTDRNGTLIQREARIQQVQQPVQIVNNIIVPKQDQPDIHNHLTIPEREKEITYNSDGYPVKIVEKSK
jgi:phage portal protein BeeE